VNIPRIVPRSEWLAARTRLLEQEKELTRRRDRLAAARRELPMVEIDKRYQLEGPDGITDLPDLFGRHRQLIVYHFMFEPDWDEGCPSCSYLADNFTGAILHLPARDTAFAVVSLAPLAKLTAFKQRMGWTFPWYSSYRSDFNADFLVNVDAAAPNSTYNYRSTAEQRAKGAIWIERGELPGVSVFLREGEHIFHTYSTYSRGLDHLINTYSYLDLTPLGRGGDDEVPYPMAWVRYHDKYDTAEEHQCSHH
jgi:predicted dithiol-disulfide oxidoreductase (DUF899 family)